MHRLWLFFFFSCEYLGSIGSRSSALLVQQVAKHQERKAKKGKVAWLCMGICESCQGSGCQGAELCRGGGPGCWDRALLPVSGCMGQWLRPGQWIRARTRPAISTAALGKWATCPASSHLTGLFLNAKGYEICSFFSGTSCPLEIPEGWREVWTASGTFLWEPRPDISLSTSHQS